MDELIDIDSLLRTVCCVPVADATEVRDLDAIQDQLEREMTAARPGRPRRPWPLAARQRTWLSMVPVVVSCVVAVVIGVVAVTAVKHRQPTPTRLLSGPAAGPGADALIAKLAVLRRPQTSADRLPANLEALLREGGEHWMGMGEIIPGLSRRVASPAGTRLYLVVTTPASGTPPLWSRRFGDQITIVAITAHGATESPGYPAIELSDSSQLILAGVTFNPGASKARWGGAYDVAIVPDGVARVRWTFASRDGTPGKTITAAAENNVAITPLTRGALARTPLHATRYAADGTVIPTNNRPLVRAQAHQANVERRQAVREIRRQNVTVPARQLAPFPVFSFNSPTGTRTTDGYVISHPPLAKVPLELLSLTGSKHQAFDFRQVRHVVALSGLSLWVIPSTSTVCFSLTDPKTADGQRTGGGIACSGSYAQADTRGTGESLGGSRLHGSVVYGVLPRTIHTVPIPTGPHTHRTIHPLAGVYIATTPFQIG